MLLQSNSSMSSLSLASPWFINDKASQCALPLCYCSKRKKLSQWYSGNVCHDTYDVRVNECVTLNAHEVSSRHANLYTSSSYKSPLLCCRCSPWTLQIFSVSMPSPFCLFRCFPIHSEPVLLPPTSQTSLHIHSTRALDYTINHSTYTRWVSNFLR